jgi:hypothetical protein
VHAVVALALPTVEAFDLAIPAQVFADPGLPLRYADQLAARYPAVEVDPDVLWVDEGAVLTSAGLAAGIDLCVQLVRADHGSDAAVSVARRMVVAPHRDGGQAQWLKRPVPPPVRAWQRPASGRGRTWPIR